MNYPSETRSAAGGKLVGPAIQDYLKQLYKLSLAEPRCTPSVLAERMGVSAPAVTKMIRRLVQLNFVNYTRNQELSLTPAGEKIALEIVRHHRLLEAYLKEALGYTWDLVDGEAEKLEHVISEEFEERIDRILGYPTHDPHGDPIPTRDGFIPQEEHSPLAEVAPGESAVVRRVRDHDPEMLRYVGLLGLYPAAQVDVIERLPYGGPLRIRVAGAEHAIGRELAENVFVERCER